MSIQVVASIILSCCLLAESELPSEQIWNLREICRMESSDYWTGPWPPAVIRTSTQAAEGDKCLEIDLEVQPGHHLRIEKNFVCDCHDGFRNMLAFGMVDEVFSPYRSLSFQYRTDVDTIAALIFRVYDREGGWLQWEIPSPGQTRQWKSVTLALPPGAWPKFNERRTGGVVWEIPAGEKEVRGKFWLDDLRMYTKCQEGLPGTAHRPEKINHQLGLNPLPVSERYPVDDFHLIMNMTGEIGMAMAEHKTELAIQRLADAVAVFKDVPGLEFFFGAEAWRVKLNPSVEELAEGKYPDPKEWLARSHETHVALSKWCEQNQVPFYVGIAKSGDHLPIIPPGTLKACIKAAPQYCRGALMGEFSIESNGGMDDVVAMMKLLKQHGLKLLYFQQSSYWFGILMPHGNAFREKILIPEFKNVFVPMSENVVPSAQGLSLASLLGLWRGGLVNDWGVSAQSWCHANMNWGGTSDQPGHIWLRMFLSMASFGGRYIEIEPKWAFDGENVPGQIVHFKQWAHNLRWVGRRRAQIDIDLDPSDPMRALRLFNRLIRNQVIMPAAGPGKVMSLSPATFQVKHTEHWSAWDLFHRAVDKDFYDGCCPNYTEMSIQVPPQDAFGYLYRSDHFYDQTLPVTDYGLVSILPQETEINADLSVFGTDGNQVYNDEQVLPAATARPLIKETFASTAAELLFRAKGCTWSAIEVGKNDYLVVLMDPEERFPVGVKTFLKINLEGQWAVYDNVSGERIASNQKEIPIAIAPAGIKILRVMKL